MNIFRLISNKQFEAARRSRDSFRIQVLRDTGVEPEELERRLYLRCRERLRAERSQLSTLNSQPR